MLYMQAPSACAVNTRRASLVYAHYEGLAKTNKTNAYMPCISKACMPGVLRICHKLRTLSKAHVSCPHKAYMPCLHTASLLRVYKASPCMYNMGTVFQERHLAQKVMVHTGPNLEMQVKKDQVRSMWD